MPKLRFPGFEGEWTKKRLSEVATGFDYGMNAAAIKFDGTNQYIRITDIDDESRCYNQSNPVSPAGILDEKYVVGVNDILFARTGASTGKSYLYKETDGKLYFAGFLIRVTVNAENNSIFVFNTTLTQKYNKWVQLTSMRSGQPGINSQEYASYTDFYPMLNEQNKIAKFLNMFELRISKQRQLIETLKKYKRGVFEAIFSQRLRLVPKEEQKSWKTFKLSDFATRITRKNSGTTDIPLTISAQYGLIDQRNFFSKVVASTDMGGYYLLHNGEYAYNRSTSNDYPFGSIKRLELYDKGAVSTLYLCFSINENVVMSDLAKWYFESSQWYQGVNEICAEGARNHGLLNVPTDGFFSTIHILPSDTEEQARIVMFLSRIHYKLVQAQKELEKLICLRNGLLQQLFI